MINPKIHFVVNFTSKPFKGYESKGFATKEEAELWVKKNKRKIYWSQIVARFPASSMARPVFLGEPGDDFERFEGKLSTYFETGMEYLGLMFTKNGMEGPPNPAFDPNKPEGASNFKSFGNYDALLEIQRGQILQIEGGDKISIYFDRLFASADGYRLSFYPQGFTKQELLNLFTPETTRAVLWVKKTQNK